MEKIVLPTVVILFQLSPIRLHVVQMELFDFKILPAAYFKIYSSKNMILPLMYGPSFLPILRVKSHVEYIIWDI